jgi:hypothetical protein
MTLWLGQLVISKHLKSPQFRVQYWRTPSMTPAHMALESVEEVCRYLRHCRLSSTTPEQVIEQLRSSTQVTVNTIESEEQVG